MKIGKVKFCFLVIMNWWLYSPYLKIHCTNALSYSNLRHILLRKCVTPRYPIFLTFIPFEKCPLICIVLYNIISRVTIYSHDVLLSQFGTSLLSMSSSNCCFLTCIQISQKAGQVVWYCHILKNFPQFVVIHKGFGLVNKAEEMFFWNSLAFSMIEPMLAIWSLVPLSFLNSAWTSGSSQFTYCWSLAWRILSITLLVCEMSAVVQ